MRMRAGCWARLLAAALLVLGQWSALVAQTAQAATESSRIAQIVRLTGDVYVKKSGGSKEFKAYVNMTLNQGDYLRTGNNASVTLKVLDRDDELTFDANSSVFLSQLKTENDGKKTNVSMWSGSVYAKASQLVGNDRLEIETPTAVMGVRGTHFISTVDATTGDTSLFVLAGVVDGSTKLPDSSNDSSGGPSGGTAGASSGSAGGGSFVSYPTMQTSILNTGGAVSVLQSILDPNALVRKAGPAVVTTMVVNHGAAAKEREEFLGAVKEGAVSLDELPPELDLDTPEAVDNLAGNLTNLTGAVVYAALEAGRLTEADVQAAMEQLREQDPDAELVIPPSAELKLTEAQQQLLQQLREREEQQERMKQLREQQRQQQAGGLLDEIAWKEEEQRRQNEEAEAERRREAEERLLEQMTPEERAAYEARRRETEQASGSPAPLPAPSTPATPSTPADPGDGAPSPAPSPTPAQPSVPSEARSEVAVVPFFNRPVLRTGADITIRLADANGNPITSVAEFRLDVTRDGESVATLLYDPAKPSESNEYRFRFAPTVDGPYLLTPVVRMAPTAEPVAFTPIAFTSEAPSIRIGYPVDQANRPIPGAFDIELHGLSGIRGLELHVLTDGLIDPESIVIDPEGLFGPGAIADWYVTTGLYDDSDQLYDELVYTVIANGDGTPTDNPARPYVLVRVTGLYHPEATALVLIAGTKVILADGLHLPFSAGGFVDAIQLN